MAEQAGSNDASVPSPHGRHPKKVAKLSLDVDLTPSATSDETGPGWGDGHSRLNFEDEVPPHHGKV